VAAVKAAALGDFGQEFLALVASVAVVDSLDEALDFIARYGSGHSEAIVTQDGAAAERFLNEVDAAAVFANASTRFNDGGEFGLGAEVAISTNKLHARGPMGLRDITSYKWVVRGDGQVRG
jgi:glutamate-5-semialdehyde dehydrogenase